MKDIGIKKNKAMKSTDISIQLFSAFGATVISAGINFITIPLITNLFSQDVYGTISLFISYQNIFLSIVYLGMDQSMSRFYFDPIGKNSNKAISTICLSISLIAFFLVEIIIILNWKKVCLLMYGRVNFIIIIYSFLFIFSQLILRYLNIISRLQKQSLEYAIQAIGITLITKLSYTLAAIYNPTSINAIMILSISSLALAIIMFSWKVKKSFSLKVDYSPFVIKQLLKFGLPQIPVFLLSNANNSIPQLVLNQYTNKSNVGLYSNAISITAILAIVQNTINVFWIPYVYENYKTKQNDIINVHHCTSYIMIIMTLMICLFKDIIYYVLVSRSYWDSMLIIPLVLISPLCYTISETLGIGFKIEKKVYWNIIIYGIDFLINFLLCHLLIPRIGMYGAAIAVAISSLSMLFLKALIGERYYRCTDSNKRLIISLVIYIFSILPYIIFRSSLTLYIFCLFGIVFITYLYRKEVIFMSKAFKELNFLKYKKISKN